MDDTILPFLHDFAKVTYDRANEAKNRCVQLRKAQSNWQFECGRAQAYYEVLTHLMNQLEVFGISKESVGFDQLNPDDLL